MPRAKKEDRQPKRVTALDATAGQRLRIRRTELGISQTAVGDELGVTFQQVQKYENGTNRLSGGRLQQLADLLQVPVTYFFEQKPAGAGKHDPGKDLVTQMLLTRDGNKLCSMWLQMRPPVRRKVLQLVETITGLERGA
jgi:transcriptional regulator with XRE-family HTH domain